MKLSMQTTTTILAVYSTWAGLLLAAAMIRMGWFRSVRLITLRILLVWMLASPFLFLMLVLGLLETRRSERKNKATEVVG